LSNHLHHKRGWTSFLRDIGKFYPVEALTKKEDIEKVEGHVIYSVEIIPLNTKEIHHLKVIENGQTYHFEKGRC